MALWIVLIRAQLGMMIQMPSRELARRDSTWNRVKQPKHSFRGWPPPFEDRVMHDLMQKDREIKDRQPLDERERHPDQRILEPNQSPRREPQNRELPSCDEEVPRCRFAVEFPHLLARDGRAELSSERNRVLGVVVGFHWRSSILAGIRRPGSGFRLPASGSLTRDLELSSLPS